MQVTYIVLNKHFLILFFFANSLWCQSELLPKHAKELSTYTLHRTYKMQVLALNFSLSLCQHLQRYKLIYHQFNTRLSFRRVVGGRCGRFYIFVTTSACILIFRLAKIFNPCTRSLKCFFCNPAIYNSKQTKLD